MIFKPTIDYSKLLRERRMTHQDLSVFFGRLPTRSELRWAREDAIAKHPEIRSLLRSSAATGLYLMDQVDAHAFNGRALRADVTRLYNRAETIESMPTNQLDAEQLKRHDNLVRCARAVTTEITKSTKSLPWGDA